MRWAATAAEIRTICTKAGVPSCIRVPPLTGAATRGSPSRVARSMPATIRSAAARPMEPARKPNSPTSTAIRRPCIRASPVSTDSSTPDFSAAAASSAAYASLTPSRAGGVSHEDQESVVEDQVDEVARGEAVHPARLAASCLRLRALPASAWCRR